LNTAIYQAGELRYEHEDKIAVSSKSAVYTNHSFLDSIFRLK